MRYRPALMTALLALPALAQNAKPAAFDEAFFDGDRRVILKACADKARSMKPKDAEWLAEYGRAYLAALDLDAAKSAFKAAEEREPKDGKILRRIANAWLKNGYKNEALETYDKILERDRKNKDALTDAGIDLAEVAMPQHADKFMEALAQEEPKDWERFLMFGKAYLGSGLRKKAAYWFARAVTVKPDEEKIYLAISQAFAESQALL
ncbi:MAG TPA: tetratricopeptide repeat protein [Holophagaceae bacterium]|nr:tetratricopeptide repeat protein [Holophagaceae bacterium]